MPKVYKKQKLNQAHQYGLVFARGQRCVTNSLTLLFYENGLDYCRLGYAVSKKSLKNAVDRNYVKRIVRESFRKQLLPVNCDIVAVSRPAIAKYQRQAIHKDLESAWGKLYNRCVKQSA